MTHTQKTIYQLQGYFLPSKFSKRLTGWQDIAGGCHPTFIDAKTQRDNKPAKTTRYTDLRIVMRTITEVVIS